MPSEIYSGEALLLRWGDNSTSGRTVTLQLPEDIPVNPFKGFPCGSKNGQRMMIVAFAIGDDEQPDMNAVAKAEKATPKFHVMSRAWQAGILCKDPKFQEFMGWTNEEDTTAYVRARCGVTSRAHLDSDAAGGTAWDALVRDYQESTGQVAEQRR